MASARQKPELRSGAGAGEGAPIDIYGGAAFDPTANVIALVEGQADAIARLREADNRFNAQEFTHLKEMAILRAANAETLRISDLDRLDKTRQVDVLAATASASALATAVQTLANTSDRNAETLRNLVNATAATMAKQTADQALVLSTQTDNLVKDINARIAELQKSQYQGVGKDPMVTDLVMKVEKLTGTIAEGVGKQAVVDPQIAEMRADQKVLIAAMTASAGQGKGMDKMWGIVAGAAFLLFGFVSIVIAVVTFVLTRTQ